MTVRSQGPTLAPRIGLWGVFDIESAADAISRRVTTAEVLRRLPDASIRVFSPYGWLNPVRFDGGEPAEPLGTWSPGRVDQLAAELDCVIVGEGAVAHLREADWAQLYAVTNEEARERNPGRFFIEGLGSDRESDCPVVWHGVRLESNPSLKEAGMIRSALVRRPRVSVADEASAERLRLTGVEREVDVVPPAALLAPRHFDAGVLDRRIEHLRGMGWFPTEGTCVVVQADGLSGAEGRVVAGALAAGLDRATFHHVVLMRTEPWRPGTGIEVIDQELKSEHRGAVFRLPDEITLEDAVAVIRAAHGFVGASQTACVIGAAYGIPILHLGSADAAGNGVLTTLFGDGDGPHVTGLDDEATLDSALQRLVAGPVLEIDPAAHERLGEHFDRMAEIAAKSGGRARQASAEDAGVEELRLAYAARGRRLAAERVAFADRVRGLQRSLGEMTDERGRLKEEIAWMNRQVEEVRAEMERLRTEEMGWLRSEIDRLEAERAAAEKRAGERDAVEQRLLAVQEERRKLKHEEIPWLRHEIQVARRSTEDARAETERVREEKRAAEGALEARIADLEARLWEHQEEIKRFYASRTWRMTAPLRKVAGFLLRPLRRR